MSPLAEIAVLFARHDSVYKTLPGCDVWDKERNALNWPGGCAGIFHPSGSLIHWRSQSRVRTSSSAIAGEVFQCDRSSCSSRGPLSPAQNAKAERSAGLLLTSNGILMVAQCIAVCQHCSTNRTRRLNVPKATSGLAGRSTGF